MKNTAKEYLSLVVAAILALTAFCAYAAMDVYADDAKSDWYEVYVYAKDDINWAYPGDSIELYTSARHLYYDDNGY